MCVQGGHDRQKLWPTFDKSRFFLQIHKQLIDLQIALSFVLEYLGTL